MRSDARRSLHEDSTVTTEVAEVSCQEVEFRFNGYGADPTTERGYNRGMTSEPGSNTRRRRTPIGCFAAVFAFGVGIGMALPSGIPIFRECGLVYAVRAFFDESALFEVWLPVTGMALHAFLLVGVCELAVKSIKVPRAEP